MTLKMLGTLNCAASNGLPIRAQCTMQIPSVERFAHFDHLSHHTKFLEENESIRYLFCQTKTMFTCELFSDKGKDTQMAQLPVAGTSVTTDWLNLSCGQKDFCNSTQAWRPGCMCSQAWHRIGLTQVNCYVNHWLLNGLPVFWSGTVRLHVKYPEHIYCFLW